MSINENEGLAEGLKGFCSFKNAYIKELGQAFQAKPTKLLKIETGDSPIRLIAQTKQHATQIFTHALPSCKNRAAEQ